MWHCIAMVILNMIEIFIEVAFHFNCFTLITIAWLEDIIQLCFWKRYRCYKHKTINCLMWGERGVFEIWSWPFEIWNLWLWFLIPCDLRVWNVIHWDLIIYWLQWYFHVYSLRWWDQTSALLKFFCNPMLDIYKMRHEACRKEVFQITCLLYSDKIVNTDIFPNCFFKYSASIKRMPKHWHQTLLSFIALLIYQDQQNINSNWKRFAKTSIEVGQQSFPGLLPFGIQKTEQSTII